MFELRVLSGQHQGAALPLVGEQWTIGAAEQQDLALEDPGIAGLHAQLQRIDEHWQINAEEGPLHDAQGLAQDRLDLEPNAVFLLGPVWLCVSAAGDDWPSAATLIAAAPLPEPDPLSTTATLEKVQPPPRKLLTYSSGVVIGVLLGVIGSAWSLPHGAPPSLARASSHLADTDPSRPVTAHNATHRAPADIAPSTSKRTPLKDVAAVRQQLQSMLSERLLTEVRIEESPQGLVLDGTLKGEALQVYQRMLQRFQNGYSSPVTVLDNVGTAHASLPFVVVQILSGPHAHLVTADGTRMYAGDERDGLRLTRIDDKHLEFDGARHIEVNW
jgi:type III secretion protein D